jgi:hypothetical protein
MMDLFLIDAIGPFFRGLKKKRINWSKIPFTHLSRSSESWQCIQQEMHRFCEQVAALGYNAVTLDDVSHVFPHPLHEPDTAENISFWREQFRELFTIIRSHGLAVYLTVDAVPMTAAIAHELAGDDDATETYFCQMIESTLHDFPELAGIVLRIGESDGKDVRDPLRSHLHVKNAAQANQLLLRLLPIFESENRTLIFRTWTVGAHGIGDLIWHRDTLERTLRDVDSPHLIVSMKHGESDFFRYLPLNQAFFRIKQRKLLELQARREYEGAGEYPSFIAADCARFRDELEGVENMAGISVWCQTGGWHRFRRRAFLEDDQRDQWIRLNVQCAIRMFRNQWSVDQCLTEIWGEALLPVAREFLHLTDEAIMHVLYIENVAQQKRFFRRVRIPPLIHSYWDSLYIHPMIRTLLREWVSDHAVAMEQSARCISQFPRLLDLSRQLQVCGDDLDHMQDLFSLMHLARQYYLADDPAPLQDCIVDAKKLYKIRWPKTQRDRYRIKTQFTATAPSSRALALACRIFLRQQRGYRWIDHLLILQPLAVLYQILRNRHASLFPKAMNKLAMGVDTLFR